MQIIDETRTKQPVRLPLVGEPPFGTDLEAELARFEAAERARLGLDGAKQHWRDEVAGTFTASQREHTTILVCGLTKAHDHFVQGALSGVGYKVECLDVPDNDALRVGKEFGNRGQCNPTYFTVGNVVKHLVWLRDEKGLSTAEIESKYLFLTAGACGPCRFGMYATEYRKALRDAGFENFRVLLFQQQGGLKQATGEKAGLEMNPRFFWAILKAIVAGDVLNAIAYRLRPYEVLPGSTDEAVAECKRILHSALSEDRAILPALLAARRILSKVRIDRTTVKPKVSIIGEFWAMTTEGDGNYELQRFLEAEGAECDVQLVSAWILFMVWENVYDTRDRMWLRGQDSGRKSLKEPAEAARKLLKLKVADGAVRAIFQGFAWAMGLEGYQLPDMDEVAREAEEHYNLNVRGGEAHMEVGKLVLTVKHKKADMVLSVKPFGCMPSSGVSDGVQTIITERHPDAVFLPIETSGDGKVNVYSRIQMTLFKARKAARAEYAKTLERVGLGVETARELQERLPWLRRSLHHAPHTHEVASSAGNFALEAARWQARLARFGGLPARLLGLAKAARAA